MKIAKIDEYPDLKDELAELLADGISMQKIADTMGVSDRGTVAEWKKRPEIQNRVTRLIQERANKILSRTTKRIEGKLDSEKEISLENLLKIHRTFAGDTLTVNTGDGTKSLEELFMAAHDDPALAAALQQLGAKAKADEEADESAPA